MSKRNAVIEITKLDHVSQGQTETLSDFGFELGQRVNADLFEDGEAVVYVADGFITLSPCEFKEI